MKTKKKLYSLKYIFQLLLLRIYSQIMTKQQQITPHKNELIFLAFKIPIYMNCKTTNKEPND